MAGLADQIGGHARRTVDRMLAGPPVCDFATDVAADLPLLALADTLGMPEQDRMLLFDWSNRVIGWQEPGLRDQRRLRPSHRYADGSPGTPRASAAPTGRQHA